MKLIVISNPEKLKNEEKFIPQLLDHGLEYFHLRKPNWTENLVAYFLSKIPSQYHNKIILHGNWDLMNDFNLAGFHMRETDKNLISGRKYNLHSIAVHELDELYQLDNNVKYALLSPVFNGISKKDVKAAFNLATLKERFSKSKPEIPVYALGGVNPENISEAKEIGFDGVAVLGFIWNTFREAGSEETLKNFKKLQTLCL